MGACDIPELEYDPTFDQRPKRAGRGASYRPRPGRRTNRYSAAEQEIIDFLQKKCGRPLTQGEIDFQLDQAKSILGPDLAG
jgi:hypothetical protein